MEKYDRNPLVSFVVSVYGVAQYLPDFLDSLIQQSADIRRVELIFVNDGTPDNSVEIIEAWIEKNDVVAKVVSKPNGGPSSARNTGLQHVSTDWVSFPDPDDVLVPEYLETVLDTLDTKDGTSTDLIVTNLQFMDDLTGEVTDTHPLRVRFKKKSQTVELNRHPDYIHLSAATGFYRIATIRQLEIEFDSRVKPNFEDAHFTAKYLMGVTSPKVTMLREAKYCYRRRNDGSSLVQTSWQKPEKYIDLPKYGYLALLQEAKEKLVRIPEWVQNVVLYDIFWYLREDDRMHSATANIDPQLAKEFHTYLEQIIALVDEHVIADFRVVKTNWYHRQELLQRFKPKPIQYTDVSVNALDVDKQIVRARYYFSGELPVETFRARGFEIQPIHATVQKYTLFGEIMMYERIAWLPATGTLSLDLDGHRIPLSPGGFPDAPYRLPASKIWRQLNKTAVPVVGEPTFQDSGNAGWRRELLRSSKRALKDTVKSGLRKYDSWTVDNTVRSLESVISREGNTGGDSVVDLFGKAHGAGKKFVDSLQGDFDSFDKFQREVILGLSKSSKISSLFKNSWTLIDRDTEAHDNAEHLYRYLAKQRPDINAWFVLTSDSSDWQRLANEGFKLVPHGSIEHLLLLLCTTHLVSSQVDHYIVHPFTPKLYKAFPWKFTFLQHGVSKDDVSRWLNRKPIDLLITASSHEYSDFVDDFGPYRFSSKDTVLTGMPRFDKLFSDALDLPESDRKTLLVMPTWRRWLLGEAVDGGNLRETLADFWESTYAESWVGFLQSDELRDFAEKFNLNVAFMPHPNMRPYLEDFNLPEHVTVYSYLDTDVQSLLVKGAVLVTDYSSVAFDGAYIGTPVIYYQFDRDEFFSGNHVFRQGDWSYDDKGLGPVTVSQNELFASLNDIANNDFHPVEEFSERVHQTFADPDAGSCERVTAAIENLRRPLTYAEAYLRITEQN
ncbi:bifunctional glycosyltransferase/CDP-glycerol:glycerophosphate glycerophosphotransferase [Glutamicibacter arilaitensis]|uniref:bifunctional glycosyltransferase/CDP-glycerol:glycerophosphate glycerophosphotransferase n=1 Tax=Glutamicibacter arilaitensis TaxID=256701 RepID=UPI0002D83CC5|nr:CDP-glycerol glycerophosphotransferase family protein [Glutamicibacter arilaitensis]